MNIWTTAAEVPRSQVPPYGTFAPGIESTWE